MSEYSIFRPKSSRTIFSDYPALRKIPAFELIKEDDFLFVWYYACESSPFFNTEDLRTRVQQALDYSYLRAGKTRITKELKEQFLLGEFPDKISIAIEQMRKYRVGPRVRAKMMMEKAFENLEKILNIDANDKKNFENKEGEIDMSKKKAYVETIAKASELLPKIIDQLEGSFHVAKNKKEEAGSPEEESLIDRYHEDRD